MSYSLPFRSGQRLVEIGGGSGTDPASKPIIRPNFDIRPGPLTDLVGDASEPLPFKDGSLDGILARYIIEHLPFKKVPGFLKEAYRALDTHGCLCLFLPNTLAQCKLAVDRGEWTDAESEMLYGSQTYFSNAHSAGFSPTHVTNLLRAAGFSKIIALRHPDAKTDLIVEAYKEATMPDHVDIGAANWTPEQRKDAYDQAYFNGGAKVGGYAREGFWDFPVHNLTAQKILELKPESVLELGCVVPGSELITNPSVQVIEGCTPGQKVFTHRGTFERITKLSTRQYNGEIVEIAGRHMQGISTGLTIEHPVWVVRVARKFKSWKAEIQSAPDWVPAGLVDRDKHWLVVPKPKRTGSLDIDPAFARLCGFYLSEGWVSHKWNKTCRNNGYLVSFAFNNKEVGYWRDVRSLMKKFYSTTDGWFEHGTRAGTGRPSVNTYTGWLEYGNRKNKGVKICFYSRKAHDELLSLFGKGARNKTIPAEWISSASDEALMGLVRGMYRGDGAKPDNDRLVFTTVSPSLAASFRLILLRLGVLSEIVKLPPRDGGIIGGKRIRGGTSWRVRVSGINYDRLAEILSDRGAVKGRTRKGGRAYMFAREDADNFYIQIKKITRRIYSGPVYNLEVEGASSYSLMNMIVHNCARGYILKRLEDKGIRAAGLEISEHCFQTRVIQDIRTFDITQVPWPVADKEFDLCYSVATMEHIPEQYIPAIAKELERVSKRGIHGIDLGQHDDGFDKTHVALKPLAWWQERLPATHRSVDKEDLERGEIPIPAGDGKLKLNIGSYTVMFHHGWINMDLLDVSEFANRHRFRFVRHDATKNLPFDDGRVGLIYTSHFLEHLDYTQGEAFLKECRRVLKPGGYIRIIVPDLHLLVERYTEDGLGGFDQLSPTAASSLYPARKFWELLMGNHRAVYDGHLLCGMLLSAGFSTAGSVGFRGGECKQILAETLDMFPTISLYVEARA